MRLLLIHQNFPGQFRQLAPYLLQQGLVQRTPRGRMLGQLGWTHLGLAVPKGQSDLFE